MLKMRLEPLLLLTKTCKKMRVVQIMKRKKKEVKSIKLKKEVSHFVQLLESKILLEKKSRKLLGNATMQESESGWSLVIT